MAKRQSLQDSCLNNLRSSGAKVCIYLVNGVKLQGQIRSFDQFSVILNSSGSYRTSSAANQIIYKHAIATISVTDSSVDILQKTCKIYKEYSVNNEDA